RAGSARPAAPPSGGRRFRAGGSLGGLTGVALAMGAVMPGGCASHDSATCAVVAPTLPAALSTAARTAKPRSFMYPFCTPTARAVEGSEAPGRYFPERKPLPSEE